MKIEGIIFDLDGTLLYTLEDLNNSVNYSLKKCNLTTITIEQTRNYVGNGVYNLIKRAVGQNIEYADKCFEIFKNHYSKNSKLYTRPYNGVIEGLKKLKDKNIKLAVLSNKLDSVTNELVEYYFNDIFDIAMGEKDSYPKKPDSKASEYIIKKFNLCKDKVIFVGDSEVDIETAKNTGVNIISVSWGYKNKEFLIKNGAKIIIDSFEEIFNYI